MLDVGCWLCFLALTLAKAASCQTLIIWRRGVKGRTVCGSIRGVVMCGFKGLRWSRGYQGDYGGLRRRTAGLMYADKVFEWAFLWSHLLNL